MSVDGAVRHAGRSVDDDGGRHEPDGAVLEAVVEPAHAVAGGHGRGGRGRSSDAEHDLVRYDGPVKPVARGGPHVNCICFQNAYICVGEDDLMRDQAPDVNRFERDDDCVCRVIQLSSVGFGERLVRGGGW